ncbi:MAG: hypothetical protein ABIR62_01485 [Dokdonella sp.]|uniref:hypothetical protein n=1 Tax=Dokdonella sp. TaxID=2291710 RepID=UPI003264F867
MQLAREPGDPNPPLTQGRVLTLADIDIDAVRSLLAKHQLDLEFVPTGQPIPGSYWGDTEAGVIAHRVYARLDTPVHSLLHEASHLIVAPVERRAFIHTDASDSQAEEDAACYLQIVLADELADVGRDRAMQDMDAWGYTFRLGSARAWFCDDAQDARTWLEHRGLLPL